jgi:hypothetical protein
MTFRRPTGPSGPSGALPTPASWLLQSFGRYTTSAAQAFNEAENSADTSFDPSQS